MAGCGNGNTAITRLCASAPRRRPGGLAMEQLHNRVKAQETDPEVAAQEITGGKNLTLYEVDEATTRIREVDADANIIVGATFDRQCPPTPAAKSYPGAGAVIQGVVNIVRPGNEPATLEFLRRDAHYRDTGATKCN